jgi:hypothetical protein
MFPKKPRERRAAACTTTLKQQASKDARGVSGPTTPSMPKRLWRYVGATSLLPLTLRQHRRQLRASETLHCRVFVGEQANGTCAVPASAPTTVIRIKLYVSLLFGVHKPEICRYAARPFIPMPGRQGPSGSFMVVSLSCIWPVLYSRTYC